MRKPLYLILLVLTISTSLLAQTGTAKTEKHEGQKIPLIDQQPEYVGGDVELKKFIESKIVYPPREKEARTEGQVLVRFAVMEDGTVGEVTVNKGINQSLDDEAVRVVKLLPKFIPATQQGMPVKAYMVLPVEFKL